MGYDTRAKVSPPLRTWDDVLAMRQALRAGIVDILSTDHAPHAAHEKEVEFEAAPNGITGLDTALAATWGLVAEGVLSEADLVRAWATRPAEIFGLPANRFRAGDPADVILFDDRAAWTVTPESLFSKSKNTPLLGKTLPGRVWASFIGGKRVV
jgi:dihydroorotase